MAASPTCDISAIAAEDLPNFVRARSNAMFASAWLRWRSGRLLPGRSEMNLRDIAAFLPGVRLLEFDEDGDVRFRLVGTGLREVYGAEMTGRSLRALTNPQDWAARHWRHRAAVDQPCGLLFATTDTFPYDKQIRYETVCLPLDAIDRAPSRRTILSHLAILDATFVDRPSELRPFPTPTSFRFVDIGAGTPPGTFSWAETDSADGTVSSPTALSDQSQ